MPSPLTSHALIAEIVPVEALTTDDRAGAHATGVPDVGLMTVESLRALGPLVLVHR